MYVDDVIIFSKSVLKHIEHLECILKALAEAGMVIQPSKCTFCVTEIEYLGHVIAPDGIRPDPAKLTAVRDFAVPTTVKAVQSFVGLGSYFRRFIKNFATIAHPLVKLTWKNTPFVWGAKEQSAFESIKELLTCAPVLAHFDPYAEIELHTDACSAGIGSCLIVRTGAAEQVLAYASRLLNGAESRYSVTEQECLAVVWSVKKFRPYLFGKHFTVITDHCALCWLMSRKEPAGRLCRWSLTLQEYDFTIVYRSGKKHQNADALSRYPVDPAPPESTDDFEFPIYTVRNSDFRAVQLADPVWGTLMRQLKAGPVRGSKYTVRDGILYRVFFSDGKEKLLVVVPKELRLSVLYTCHDERSAGHLGFARTWSRVRTRYFWPRMLTHVRRYVAGCVDCQMRKIPKSAPAGRVEAVPVGSPFRCAV